ncbi:MAG TPA: nicotinate-nucleotide--dimethylbenzimidazole phosphoribosyltransferase [Ilumatobacter sp.]|nr:nicotinate-nucleotide--dimethylbenzimidazole phosphoribosyltransferase [Ilumatobacter sp.]
MTSVLRQALDGLPEPDHEAAATVAAWAADVLRPPGALAALDAIAVHLAGWQGTDRPSVQRPAVLVFAGDHGVTTGGVSNYPADITAAMLAAVQQGRATVNAMAGAAGATVDVVDVGVGRPTGDIRFEPALTAERFDEISATAFTRVDELAERGTDVLILGELGIGNTTVAAALTTSFADVSVDRSVGRGTGIDDAGLARKRAAVTQATQRCAAIADPLDRLRELGGSELVAIAAACVRARHRRLPVLLDGYVVTAAMLALAAAVPGALGHCLAGHASAEPGHRLVLEHLGLRPILDLDLRLGEGTGALAALPLLELACRAVTDVATFAEWFGADAAPAP